MSQKEFLLELQQLMGKYDVSICSKSEPKTPFGGSQVYFQFYNEKTLKMKNYYTTRNHSSEFEIGRMAKELK